MSGHTARQLLLLLLVLPGPLFASTSLLPSSFTMYFLTAAAAYVIEGRPLRVAMLGILGVLWGWPVAGVSFTSLPSHRSCIGAVGAAFCSAYSLHTGAVCFGGCAGTWLAALCQGVPMKHANSPAMSLQSPLSRM